MEALRYHKPQGAKPRLTAAQKTELLGSCGKARPHTASRVMFGPASASRR